MRLNYREVLPDALRAMLGLERAANSGLDDPRLLDLVKIRASQINGCAHCVRLHTAEAREASQHFTSEQIVALTLAIVAINGWNRLNVGFRTPVADATRGDYSEAA
jgi:AhpD family alkylhydroperoxidase